MKAFPCVPRLKKVQREREIFMINKALSQRAKWPYLRYKDLAFCGE